jgi:diguanylate cyclase (GGDEF)-like protein/PAS domain S-box-containing protein
MIVSDSGMLLEGSGEIVQRDSDAIAPFHGAALPTTQDLRRLLEFADEQGVMALETLCALLAAIEHRDPNTARHCHRTAGWCALLANMARISSRDAATLVVAALLHDLGKIGIADEILWKPSPLDADESRVMREYSSITARIVAAFPADQSVVQLLAANEQDEGHGESNSAPAHSHLSRILAVADAFDAMTNEQPYRKALSRSDAIQQLRTGSRQFDADVVSLLEFSLSTVPEHIKMPGGTLADLSNEPQPTTAEKLMRTGTMGIVEALNLVSDAVWLVDDQLRIRMWNERAEALTGHSAQEMLGTVWNGATIDYVGQVSLPREQRKSLMTRCLAAGTTLTERGYLWNVRGDCIPVESRVMLMRDECQQTIGAIEIIRDLSREVSLQSENEQLRRVTQTDPLTQVLNRAAFERTLNEQVESVNRRGTRCSLILLDIDFFKSVNDTFGHPVGDLVLKSFANLLMHCIRPTDVVARYGGEEFALLLPDCNLATAYDRAEHLRAQFPSLRLSELKGRAITASLGVTEIQVGDTESSVVVRADEALYRSKENGRNRTEVAYAETTRQDDHEFACSWTISGPAELAMMKLTGFVRRWRAQPVQSDAGSVLFRIGKRSVLQRVGLRTGELPVEVHLSFARTHISERTQVQVAIRALVERPAAREFHNRCCEILATLRSYLMADSAGTGQVNSE